MSLVNEMLNELQQRNVIQSNYHYFSVDNSKSKDRTRYLVLLISAVVISLIILVISKITKWPSLSVNNQTTNTSKIHNISQNKASLSDKKMVDVFSNRLDHINNIPEDVNSPIQKNAVEKKLDTSIMDNSISAKNIIATVSKNTETAKVTTPSENKAAPPPSQIITIRSRNNAQKELKSLLSNWDSVEQSKNLLKLEELYKSNPENLKLRVESVSFLLTNYPKIGQEFLFLALDSFPQSSQLLFFAANIAFKNNELDASLNFLERIKIKEWSLSSYKLAGVISQKQQKHYKAIGYYNKVLTNNRKLSPINMAIAISYQSINNKNKAIEFFRRSLKGTGLTDTQKTFVLQRLAVLEN